MSSVQGEAAPGYEAVRAAFAGLFDDPEEVGAAFAVSRDGHPVVDLWGGIADAATGRPWERDTTVLIYSGTKGLTAFCLLLLWDRGLLDDALTVAHYWPEFAQAGKGDITVRQVLGHTGGLPGLRRRYTFEELVDSEGFARQVAAEPPFWPAGKFIAYHAKTFGTIAAELVRRIDGRSIGRFLAEELSGPLGLEIWLGLPEEIVPRLAPLVAEAPWALIGPLDGLAEKDREALEALLYDPPAPEGVVNWNRPEGYRAEVASSGAVATARSMARLYSLLSSGGMLDGARVLSAAAVRRALTPVRRGRHWLGEQEVVFGPGFQLDTPLVPPSAPLLRGVGHAGFGGSIHGAWPELGVSFSFAVNRLLPVGETRGLDLLDALFTCLEPAGWRAPGRRGPARALPPRRRSS